MSSVEHKRIFFILHLPPPIHGAAMIGKYIRDSSVINQAFECRYFNLTLAKSLQDIGKTGLRKLWNFILQLIYIYKEIKEFGPDLCYVTPNAKGWAFYKDFIVIMMLKIISQKIVIHYHNKGVAIYQKKTLDNFLYKQFFKDLKVILLAESLYMDVCKYVKRKDVFICPNGIPEQEIISSKKPHKVFNILFLSNMMKEKGVWELVETCWILKERGKEFHCNFVGKWSNINEFDFKNQIQKYGLETYVTAYGAKYGIEKNEFFQEADIFVFPSSNECFPLVLLEAMEHGITCISTQEGGISDIIEDGKTGYIVEKQHPQALVEKIEYLINQPELLKSMGEKGKKKFKQEFTLEQFENRMRDILQEILTSCI